MEILHQSPTFFFSVGYSRHQGDAMEVNGGQVGTIAQVFRLSVRL